MDYDIVEYFLFKLTEFFLEMNDRTPLFSRPSMLAVTGVCANDDLFAVFLFYIADDAYRRTAEYEYIANLNSSRVHI